MFYLLYLHFKTIICLCLHLFHFRFHAAGVSPHLRGHLCCLLFHISHLTTGDSSHLFRLFFHICNLISHRFRGELPHLIQLFFLLGKLLCWLLADSTPRIFCLLKICIQIILHLSDLAAGITPCLCHCLSWLLPCLNQLILQTMHLLPPFLTFSLNHIFQYVKLLLAVVNGTLVILCIIVCLGFEVLDLVLQICHFTLISILWNYLGPFILVVVLVWNGCILVLKGCILAFYLC